MTPPPPEREAIPPSTPRPEPEPAVDDAAAEAREAHEHIQRRQLGEPLPPSPHARATALEHAEGLASFHAALDRLRAGEDTKVRVLVYGASSTAGDRYTGYLRGYLQHRFGDGGPGFVALVPLWKYHRHQEVDTRTSGRWFVTQTLKPRGRADNRYGLLGARATGRYAGTRLTVTFDEPDRRAASWSIWYLGDPGGGAFTAQLDDASPVQVDTRRDAIEPGYAELGGPEPHARLRLSVRGGKPVRLFGAVIEGAGPGVVVDTLGIGGSGARRFLWWDEPIWSEHVARRGPALVVFAYGNIEAMRKVHDPQRFEQEWRDIFARTERAVPEASCLVVLPQDVAFRRDGRRQRPKAMDSILEIIRRVADDEGCALFDTPAFMGGPGSMPAWVEADLAMKDHVHFTPRGYAYLGQALADAIMGPYDERG